MSPARRTGLIICNSLFRFTLLTTISLVVFQLSFRTPKLIKQSLTETKAYERFVPSIIEANTKNQQNGSLPLDDPKIQAIAIKDFSPQLLQSNAEQFIDATYSWLEGKTFQPRFRLDFSQAKLQFANDLGAYAVTRLADLPTCAVTPSEVTLDPFRATCLPRGVRLEGQDQEIAAAITGSPQFLPKTIFTADDLPKNDAGDTITEQLSSVPLIFSFSYWLMWLAASLTLLLAVGMVWLRPSRWVGWRSLGIAVLSDGAFLAVSTLIFGRWLPGLTRNLQTQLSGGGGTELILNDAVQHASQHVETLFINIGIQLAALGAIITAGERFMRPNSPFRGLERMSGLVSGVKPLDDKSLHLLAAEIPIQSSERDIVSTSSSGKQKRFADLEEEIA